MNTWGTGSDNENDGEDDAGTMASADAILRDFKYKLQCTYMEPARDLRVGASNKRAVQSLFFAEHCPVGMT